MFVTVSGFLQMLNMLLPVIACIIFILIFAGVAPHSLNPLCYLPTGIEWRMLARSHPKPANLEPVEQAFYQTILSNKSGYGRCVCIGTSSSGLFLSVPMPLSLWHKPLYIPWENVRRLPLRIYMWGYPERIAVSGIIFSLSPFSKGYKFIKEHLSQEDLDAI